MFSLYNVVLFAVLGAALGWWWRTSALKVRALAIAREHCARRGLQLLDQTLAFMKHRVEKDARGKYRLCRYYEFDFCADGLERYKGTLVLAGPSVIRIVLQADRAEITEW